MRVETSPSLRCMRGPYFRERSRRVWCGNGPTKLCMFPIIGSFLGPGGRFGDEDEFFLGHNLLLNFAKKIEEKMKMMRVMIVEDMNDEFWSSIII